MNLARRTLWAIVALGVVATVHANPIDWGTVRAMGGIRVGDPVQTSAGWRLPVHANVAGIETITQRPTLQNAQLKCAAVTALIEGHSIYLTIETTVQSLGGSARCRTAALGHPAPGSYRVYYRSPTSPPVSLREVRISR